MREYEKQIEVRIGTLSAMDSRAEQLVEIQMRDDVSGELLGEVRIPASMMWSLVQGGIKRVPGTYSPNLHRVGKRMENVRVGLGRTPSQIGYDKANQTQWALNAAQTRAEMAEYETVEVRATNTGWDAIYRRWV